MGSLSANVTILVPPSAYEKILKVARKHNLTVQDVYRIYIYRYLGIPAPEPSGYKNKENRKLLKGVVPLKVNLPPDVYMRLKAKCRDYSIFTAKILLDIELSGDIKIK